MEKVNKKWLMEDVKFPLKWDSDSYKMYIFDKENNMISQVDMDMDATKEKHPFEKLIGDYKEVKTHRNNPFKLKNGDYIDNETGRMIGLDRGWGRLQYKDNPEKRQDNIALYILNVINS